MCVQIAKNSNKYLSRRTIGRRLRDAGAVEVKAFTGTKIYFEVLKKYQLIFDLTTMSFKGACTCPAGSMWSVNNQQCRHVYAVKAWLEKDLKDFLAVKKNQVRK